MDEVWKSGDPRAGLYLLVKECAFWCFESYQVTEILFVTLARIISIVIDIEHHQKYCYYYIVIVFLISFIYIHNTSHA